MNWKPTLGLLVFAVGLGGCSSTPKDPIADAQAQPAAARQAAISEYTDWQVEGKISLTTPNEAIAASLDWQQWQDDFSVALSVLFGQRALLVEQIGPQATLQAKGRDTTTGRSAELLVLQHLGVRVPFVQLAYWLRGLPGTQGRAQYDRFGRLHTLSYQDPDGRDWRAKVKSYSRVEDLDLPRTIEVTDEAHAIRVVVTGWKLGLPVSRNPPAEQSTPPKRLTIPGATS